MWGRVNTTEYPLCAKDLKTVSHLIIWHPYEIDPNLQEETLKVAVICSRSQSWQVAKAGFEPRQCGSRASNLWTTKQ